MMRSDFALPGQRRPAPNSYPGLAVADTAIAADCGRFFRNLRNHLDVSRLQLARRVGCDVSVIAALERGDAGDLPPWPETVRIVTALAAPLGLDPRPALQLIGRIWSGEPRGALAPDVEAPAEPRRVANAARPTDLPRALAWDLAGRARCVGARWIEWVHGLPRRDWAPPSWSLSAWAWPRWPRPRWTAWRFLFAMGAVLAFALMWTQPVSFTATAAQVPAPIADVVRLTREFLLIQSAPSRDGLRWIEVDDPRSRRSDRLPSSARAG